MSYNTKNYTEQGGDKTVIGGEVDITGTCKLKGNTITQVPKMAASTASTVAGIVADYNLLLTAMTSAGIMKSE